MNDSRVPDVGELNIQHLDLIDEIDAWLSRQPIDNKDILFRGSAALAVRGIRKQGDVDVAISQQNYTKVDKTELPNRISLSSICYDIINLDVEEIIYNRKYHDLVDGYKIVRPEIPFFRKSIMNRTKDHMDRVTLHNYAKNNPDDWSWQLVTDITEPTFSDPRLLVYKFFRELNNEGLHHTLKATYWYIKSAVDNAVGHIRPKRLHKRVAASGTATDLKSLTESTDIYALIGDILESGYENGTFTRYDVVVQAMFINNHIGIENFKIEFEKATEILQRDNLISPKWGENLRHKPIKLCKDGTVRESSELATSIALGRDIVQISIGNSRNEREIGNFDERWVEKRFSPNEVKEIIEYWDRIQTNYAMYYYVIVWPYALEYLDLIEAELEKSFEIVTAKKRDVNDFSSFVRQAFSVRNNKSTYDIDLKLENTENDSENVCVFKLKSIGRDTTDALNDTDDVITSTYYSENGIKPAQLLYTTEDVTENKLISTLVSELDEIRE